MERKMKQETETAGQKKIKTLGSIETKFNPEQLIREVERRPILWDVKIPEYMDREKRAQCWKEITEVFADESMSDDDKRKLGKNNLKNFFYF